MRTLEKNKVSLWAVKKTIGAELRDADGFLTGEVGITYGAPFKVRLPLYPSNGDIAQQLFGTGSAFDMISVSNDILLNKNDYLFYSEPSGNFDATYDFMVESAQHSLNSHSYGLKSRVK